MYDELVKRIWECASGECFNCSQYTPTTNASVCQKELMKQAADAIEDLEFACNRYEKDYKALCAYLPKWIPVAERLPEKTGVYLAWMKWDLTEPEEEPSASPIEYDAEEEAFGRWKSYYDAETFGWAGEDFIRYEGITHWMPLPTPPKEDA